MNNVKVSTRRGEVHLEANDGASTFSLVMVPEEAKNLARLILKKANEVSPAIVIPAEVRSL